MNSLKSSSQFLIRMIGVLALIISIGNSGHALAASSTTDISVTIVADKSSVRPGEVITYTVTATNLGPDSANFVDVIHSLPDQLSLVSLTCAKGTSPDTPFCEYTVFESGETLVSTLVATPNAIAKNRVRNVTTIASIGFETTDTVDPNSNNNSASVMVRLIGALNHP